MIEEHIIKFKYNNDIWYRFKNTNNDFYYSYFFITVDVEGRLYQGITIYYNNMYTYYDVERDCNYMINISNILYKLHNPKFYSKTNWNKELI